ncbi:MULTISPECIES: endonuclease/exonuclease/phosphatase family protein [unclassified Sphingomonas]|uniref:endonuclease/exonuclease/phosphatase family protein n=1 Tax=unclassified Sphingomonas TaxID=196159 RepID=UPI0003140B00|nr:MULTISPECIES: endonuclease/exonuclease/phosphatase family protein [unclassified Sphingomonas]
MIKVVSYNMHKGIGLDRRRDPRRILDVLQEIDGDVIALQEADLRYGTKAAIIPHRLLEDHSPWRAVPLPHDRASMGWHGNALLARKGIDVLAASTLHIPTLEPRGAIRVDLSIESTPIRVVGMHLDLSGLWRRRQARAILAHADDGTPGLPTVMMGDLNEWTPNGGCLHDFRRAFEIVPTGPSFHARRAIGRLDRIMTRGFRVRDCGVHTSALARKASDHLPIWALIEPL